VTKATSIDGAIVLGNNKRQSKHSTSSSFHHMERSITYLFWLQVVNGWISGRRQSEHGN